MVAYSFNQSTQEGEAGGSLSSKTARVTPRNPVLEKRTNIKPPHPPQKKRVSALDHIKEFGAKQSLRFLKHATSQKI